MDYKLGNHIFIRNWMFLINHTYPIKLYVNKKYMPTELLQNKNIHFISGENIENLNTLDVSIVHINV